MQGVFDVYVWDHFACDFAESCQAVGDSKEAVLVEEAYVPGVVPSVFYDFGGLLWHLEVADHDGGAFDVNKAGLARFESIAGFGTNDSHMNAGYWSADGIFPEAVRLSGFVEMLGQV